MSDPYADLGKAEKGVQIAIADAMDARSIDPAQVAMRHDYLSEITLAPGAFAVEMGSGTGHVTRNLVTLMRADHALGIEPSQIMTDSRKPVLRVHVLSQPPIRKTGITPAQSCTRSPCAVTRIRIDVQDETDGRSTRQIPDGHCQRRR